MNTRTANRGVPRWVLAVVGLLVLHASGMAIAASIATSDPTFKSAPNSYDRAVRWDELAAERAASERLGWSATYAPSALRDRVVVTLRDATGVAVEGARGVLSGYHIARVGDVAERPLAARGGGWYDAALDVARPGLWKLALAVERGEGERFVSEFELVVEPLAIDGLGAEHERSEASP